MSLSVGRSLCERYHEATSYTPQSIAKHPRLDFSRQPSPFKSWHQARRIDLPGGPSTPPEPTPGPMDLERLGRLLFHTYGVTLVREFPGMSMHFRAAPSAGGLYPTELYVVVRDIPGVPDGILDYHAVDHSLFVCWEGDFWRDLERYTFGHPAIEHAQVVLIGTAVYERSTWRYHDRAYRRMLLDAGHVFGNAASVAPQDGQMLVPIVDFVDAAIDGLLLLDDNAEGTVMMAALVNLDDAPSSPRAPLRSPVRHDVQGPTGEHWIPLIHTAGRLVEPESAVPEPQPDPGPEPISDPVPLESEPLASGAAVLETIRRRRSTRSLQPGPVPISVLGRILSHAGTIEGTPSGGLRLLDGLLQTWVVVASVSTLPSGVYRYDPASHSLSPVRDGNPRQALFECCLRQELGRDCAFAVIHTFDLEAGVARFGERVYRTAHFEAGLIGQRLNLGAIQLGYGVSGIGGFFDEFVNALLLLDPQHAIAYITTIGIPS